jgi:hypothetical protein
MQSANIAYQHVSDELLHKVLTPLLGDCGYELTDYHLVGGSKFPDYTLVSIRAVPDSEKTPSEAIKEVGEQSDDLCRRINQEPGRDTSRPRLNGIGLSAAFEILGEYSDHETATQLFPAIALEYSLKSAGDKHRDLVQKLHRFGEKLRGL